MDTQHIDEQLLWGYFSGVLSTTQRLEVEEWLRQSEDNRRIARDIQYIHLATDTLNTITSIDTANALKQVKGKIAQSHKVTYLVQIQRIAAVLVIPLLITTLYFALKEEPVKYVEVRTNPGMVATVDLPDRSKVWLNSGSYLKYPQQFTGNTRTVEIDGEAYFSIHTDKSRKFVVQTPFNLKAEVLGTEFNIEAYKESDKVTTALISGSVKLSFMNKEEQEEFVIMKPDEEVSYHTKSKKIEIQTAYLPTQVAWKEGLVVFRNTSFENALNILSKRFNTKFIVKNDLLYDNSFTGMFSGQHLHLILEHFRLSTGIQYKFIDPDISGGNTSEKTVIELY